MTFKTGQAASMVWRQHVEAFKKSGLTRPAYFRKGPIRVSRLDYWRRNISNAGIAKEAAQWVPVTIAEEAAEADPGIQLWIRKLRIELALDLIPNLCPGSYGPWAAHAEPGSGGAGLSCTPGQPICANPSIVGARKRRLLP